MEAREWTLPLSRISRSLVHRGSLAGNCRLRQALDTPREAGPGLRAMGEATSIALLGLHFLVLFQAFSEVLPGSQPGLSCVGGD